MVLENQRSATFSAKKLSKLFQRRNKYWIRICLVEFGDKKCARFSVRDEPATWNLARVRGKWLDPKKEKKHKKATRKMASYNVTILDMFFLWRGLMSKLRQYVKLGLTSGHPRSGTKQGVATIAGWHWHPLKPGAFWTVDWRLLLMFLLPLICLNHVESVLNRFTSICIVKGLGTQEAIFIASIAPASSFCADWWNQLRRDHCKLLRFFQMPTAKRRKVCRAVSSFQ